MNILSKALTFAFLTLFIIGCNSVRDFRTPKTYPRMVGDIAPDLSVDSPEFKTCNGDDNVIQYFNTMDGFRYKGEKSALISEVMDAYNPLEGTENLNAYFRVRFIVNCNGEAGRFRIISSDLDYHRKEFGIAVENQLLAIIKSFDGWQILKHKEKPLDYYLYIIFKIEKGMITEILP